MAVADAYDALMAGHNYKAPVSHKKAVKTIERESGTHFDPKIVEVFKEIHENLVTVRLASDGMLL